MPPATNHQVPAAGHVDRPAGSERAAHADAVARLLADKGVGGLADRAHGVNQAVMLRRDRR